MAGSRWRCSRDGAGGLREDRRRRRREHSGEAPAAGKEPYVIGAMFAVTGDASALGVPEKNSATMLEKKLNAEGGIDGHPVKIVIEDTKGEPTEAVNAIKRLVEKDKVLAVVGPTRTGETMAVVDYAEGAGVPLVSCALGIEIVQPVKKWVFKTPPPIAPRWRRSRST